MSTTITLESPALGATFIFDAERAAVVADLLAPALDGLPADETLAALAFYMGALVAREHAPELAAGEVTPEMLAAMAGFVVERIAGSMLKAIVT
jgi:hypothetical protein